MPLKNIVLLIDGDPTHAETLRLALAGVDDRSPVLECASTLESGLARLAKSDLWAVFVNLHLADSHGVDTFDRRLPVISTAPVVVIGRADDEALCKGAMLLGAHDYLLEGHLDSYAFAHALRNVNEREVARRELFGEKERAQVTLNSIGDAVMSTDIHGTLTYLNVVAERMSGWTSQDAVGRPLAEVFRIIDSVNHTPAVDPAKLAIELNKTVGLSANCLLVRRDGQLVAIEDSAAPIHDRDGVITGAVIVFHDVSMAQTLVLEMSHLAQHDALTDLPNRLLLKDRLTQSIVLARRKHRHLAVLFLDLDGFKRINDSLGHPVGDQLLAAIAVSLSASVRKSDTVSRQGGDEFVILLPEVTHAEDAALKAAQIISEIKKTHHVGEHRLRVTASIGIKYYPDNGEDAETLLKNADTAMYHAKEQGRDRYQFFNTEMTRRAVERQSLEGQLRYALEERELVLHYQPKVNLTTGAITSAEALVRWQHPDRGLLMPGEFLTIAEDSGMIVPIGRWVLHEACRQTREWLDAGLNAVPVAVNISSAEFRSDEFLEDVQAALESTRLSPGYLELEMTETALMRRTGTTKLVLDALKAIGVRLAIDDFGTGYSSLSYLTRFTVDALKLDQSLVQDIVARSDDAIVASAVITMGKRLKHRVIAEGVETAGQLAFLRAHGCDEAQGYCFSRPVGADQFAVLLEAGLPSPSLA